MNEFSTFISDFRRLPEYRKGEVSVKNIFPNLLFIGSLLWKGDKLTYNSFEEYGPIYLFMVPLVIYGFLISLIEAYHSIKKREVRYETFIVFFFISAYITVLLIETPNIGISNEIYLPIILFCIIAIYKISTQNVKISLAILAAGIISFISYANFYFCHQTEVYGMHEMFYSTKLGDIVAYAEKYYNPSGQKTLYVEQQYEDQGHDTLFIGLYGDVPAGIWSREGTDFDKIQVHLPEEINVNESAVYIIGHDWSGIISYMLAQGFYADESFSNYTILVK